LIIAVIVENSSPISTIIIDDYVKTIKEFVQRLCLLFYGRGGIRLVDL
jgi:hypothetical protein